MLAATAIFVAMGVLIFTLLTDGCMQAQESRTPVSYHDTLVVQQKRLVDQTEKLNAAIETYVREDMDFELQALKNQVKASEELMSNTTPFENDTLLRKGLKILLDEYQDLMDNEYNQVIELMRKPDTDFNDADQNKVDSLNKVIDTKSEKSYEEFAQRVKAFRSKYNIITK
jgi:hypothetical protein